MSRGNTIDPYGATPIWAPPSPASTTRRRLVKLVMVSTFPSDKRTRFACGSAPPVVKYRYLPSCETHQFTKLPESSSDHFCDLKSKYNNFVNASPAASPSCPTHVPPPLPSEDGTTLNSLVRKSKVCK